MVVVDTQHPIPRLTITGCGTPDVETLLYQLLIMSQEELYTLEFLVEVEDMIH